MTKKILSVLLAVMMIVSVCTFTVSADEVVYYVEEGSAGDGSEDDPFGSIQEAILALGGKDGTVMVYGTYNIGTFKLAAWEGMVTIKGVNSDSVLTLPKSAGVEFSGDITFKDINFELEANSHFNPNNGKLIFDGGEDSNFSTFVHLGMLGSKVVEEGYAEVNSGKIGRIDFGGAYCTSLANGVMGDHTLVVNGGEIATIRFSADRYMDTHTGISVGGNMNLIVNGGKIGSISCEGKTAPEIMGALNIIFNNGVNAPEKLTYPVTVSAGMFIIKSAEGGMIMPTVDAGVFEVKANKGKIAVINGEQVLNGNVTLEPGEIEVTWVDGEQAEESVEIKLVIGKAEIVTNGEAKALDVPAQIIKSDRSHVVL